MINALIVLALAMALTFAAQFFPRAEERRRNPAEVYFSGGYWFSVLRPTGRVLLAPGWVLAVVALFMAAAALGLLR